MNDVSKPVEVATQEDINLWYTLKDQLAAIKDQEMALRRKICASFFKEPKEGTNTIPLSDGWVMKMQRVVDRKLEFGLFEAFRDTFEGAGVAVNDIVKNKPELVLKEYRELTAEQQQLFDKCLVIKDGSPQLEITKPKRAVR